MIWGRGCRHITPPIFLLRSMARSRRNNVRITWPEDVPDGRLQPVPKQSVFAEAIHSSESSFHGCALEPHHVRRRAPFRGLFRYSSLLAATWKSAERNLLCPFRQLWLACCRVFASLQPGRLLNSRNNNIPDRCSHDVRKTGSFICPIQFRPAPVRVQSLRPLKPRNVVYLAATPFSLSIHCLSRALNSIPTSC